MAFACLIALSKTKSQLDAFVDDKQEHPSQSKKIGMKS